MSFRRLLGIEFQTGLDERREARADALDGGALGALSFVQALLDEGERIAGVDLAEIVHEEHPDDPGDIVPRCVPVKDDGKERDLPAVLRGILEPIETERADLPRDGPASRSPRGI